MTSVAAEGQTWGADAVSDVAATSDASTFSSLTWKQNIFFTYKFVWSSSCGIRLMKCEQQEASPSWTAPHCGLMAV
jgi:hypothetical protein